MLFTFSREISATDDTIYITFLLILAPCYPNTHILGYPCGIIPHKKLNKVAIDKKDDREAIVKDRSALIMHPEQRNRQNIQSVIIFLEQ
jgi:hypothetical protein